MRPRGTARRSLKEVGAPGCLPGRLHVSSGQEAALSHRVKIPGQVSRSARGRFHGFL